jgi:hypothetical protein
MLNYEIETDDHSFSPREWDNLGVIVTWHRRYGLGDQQPTHAPSEWLDNLKARDPSAIVIPVYMYEHGGITISTSPFNCRFDSGQLGYIYTTLDRAKQFRVQAWKRWTKARRAECEAVLHREIAEYDQFLRGDVYSYKILDDGEVLDSAGGYYDRDECEADAQAIIDNLLLKAA